jgi:hypothetical protein
MCGEGEKGTKVREHAKDKIGRDFCGGGNGHLNSVPTAKSHARIKTHQIRRLWVR